MITISKNADGESVVNGFVPHSQEVCDEWKEKIKGLNGKVITSYHIKADGVVRKMNGRMGVGKYTNGKGKNFNDDDYNLITLYLMNEGVYRTIKLSRLLKVKSEGDTFLLTDDPTLLNLVA